MSTAEVVAQRSAAVLPAHATASSSKSSSMSKPSSSSSSSSKTASTTAAATLERFQAQFATSRPKRLRSPGTVKDDSEGRIPKQRQRSFTKTMDPPVLSFYGEKPVPLPSRFGHLKRKLVAGHEHALEASWGRLLVALSEEIKHVEAGGTALIPSIDFGEIDSSTKVSHFSRHVKRYGIGIVRGVVAKPDAEAWVDETKKYLETKHEFKPPPAQDPTCFDFFWSPCQVRARAHPNVLAAQRFAMSVWETTDDDRLATRFPICYADRIRIDTSTTSDLNVGNALEEALPPASSTLIAQVDNGSLERWEVDGYGHSGCYDAIWKGDWESYNPWDPTGRINATTDLYNGAGACSMFRMFQGILALTTVEPGMVRLLPSPKLATAYFLLRPLFSPKTSPPTKSRAEDPESWDAYMDAANWQLEKEQSTIIHGAVPGHAQRVTDTWHPHLRLNSSLVAPPTLRPGDYIIWHPDQPYAFEKSPPSLSMLVYTPAAPLTQTNALFLARQRKAFQRGHPGPDFDSTGSGLGSEAPHTGRLDEKDIAEVGGQEGLQAMGLAPWILDKSMVEESKMGTPEESKLGTPEELVNTLELKPVLTNGISNKPEGKISATEADVARIANMVLFPERFDFWMPSRVATPALDGKGKELETK